MDLFLVRDMSEQLRKQSVNALALFTPAKVKEISSTSKALDIKDLEHRPFLLRKLNFCLFLYLSKCPVSLPTPEYYYISEWDFIAGSRGHRTDLQGCWGLAMVKMLHLETDKLPHCRSWRFRSCQSKSHRRPARSGILWADPPSSLEWSCAGSRESGLLQAKPMNNENLTIQDNWISQIPFLWTDDEP